MLADGYGGVVGCSNIRGSVGSRGGGGDGTYVDLND